MAVVGVVALVLVVVAAVLGLGVWNVGTVNDQSQVDEATRSAPSAAERAASSILSYSYQSLDADEKAAERYMTPAYEKKYAAHLRQAGPPERRQGPGQGRGPR